MPDIDTNIPPSDLEQWSLAPSASAQVRKDLVTQTKLRKLAEKKSREIKKRCDELEAKLLAAQVARERSAVRSASRSARAEARGAAPAARPQTAGNTMVDLLESQRAYRDELSLSEDDAPSSPEEESAKLPTFEDLNSIVCECAMDRVKPTHKGDITFDLCAELCDEEIEEMDKWGNDQKKRCHPMIISALRMLFPKKSDSWFKSKRYLQSPKGTALYWRKVLVQKSRAWKKIIQEEKRRVRRKRDAATAAVSTPVQQRIRQKVRRKRDQDASPAKPSSPDGKQSTPIVIGTDSSHSEASDIAEDTEENVPLTQTESSAAPTAQKEPKLAPGPETYSRSEMKTFAKMATTINNVDVTKGHSAAVADFIDAEFSDNSGMMIKARSARRDSWRKKRFNSACEKVAKIMEERYVHIPHDLTQRARVVVPQHPCTRQSSPLQPGRQASRRGKETPPKRSV